MKEDYILQAHNSWSYLKPRKWWMKLLRFTARCQSKTIQEQYTNYEVRSFDLRVRFTKEDGLIIAHGPIEYDYNLIQIYSDLDMINRWGDCSVRILHEARNKKQYSGFSLDCFREFCRHLEEKYTGIKFFCGRNLYNWNVDYEFEYKPSMEEKYSSVCPPKYLDDWFPWIYARLNNRKNLEEGTDADILSIDFVNIQ